MKAHRTKRAVRTARERDLMELLENVGERDRRLFDALAVIATHGDARVLAAVGTVVDFAVRATRRAR